MEEPTINTTYMEDLLADLEMWAGDNVDTAKEWAETALEWTESDGNDTEPLRKLFDELLEQGKGKEVIDTIAEWWWLEFCEVIGKRDYRRP